jgi:hypothetical protein
LSTYLSRNCRAQVSRATGNDCDPCCKLQCFPLNEAIVLKLAAGSLARASRSVVPNGSKVRSGGASGYMLTADL